jgi:hypothetical protein
MFGRTCTAPTTWTLDLTGTKYLSNHSIRIANTGNADIVNPWVVANDTGNWFDTTSTLKETVGTGLTQQLQAYAIWQLMCANTYNWSPPEAYDEMHSPVKILNVYGYGLCDDIARVSECLYNKSGMTQARIWDLFGHVVTDVYYNSSWHMLDADLGVFYPKRDNLTAASVTDCANDGWLVSRVSGDAIAQLYTTKSNNSGAQGQWSTDHTMAMRLRPGESLERYYTNWGKYHDIWDHLEPPEYGNGLHVYAPDLSGNTFLDGFYDIADLETTDSSSGKPNVHLAPGATSGELACELYCPYAYVGGRVTMKGVVPVDGDQIQVMFSKDKVAWNTVGTLTKGFPGEQSFSLDSGIATSSSTACYRFYVKFRLLSPTANQDLGLNALAVAGEIQCAPRALPSLVHGQVNPIAVSFNPVPDARLAVELRWHEEPGVDMTGVPAYPISPPNGLKVPTLTPILSWQSRAPDDPEVWRELVVSWDAKGIRPVSPALMFKGSSTNSWQVPAGWLLNGKTYYWHVREFTEENPWSATWSFTVDTTSGVGDWKQY